MVVKVLLIFANILKNTYTKIVADFILGAMHVFIKKSVSVRDKYWIQMDFVLIDFKIITKAGIKIGIFKKSSTPCIKKMRKYLEFSRVLIDLISMMRIYFI